MIASYDDLKLELWLRNRNSGSIVWKTKTDKLIPLKDMDTVHIQNAITTIEKYNNHIEEVYEGYSADNW